MPEISDKKLRQRILEKANGKCWYCGCELETGRLTKPHTRLMSVDHYHPQINGGADDESNLVPSCRSCNSIKNSREIEHFRHLKAMSIFKEKTGVSFNRDQWDYLIEFMGEPPHFARYIFYFETLRNEQ